MAYCSPACQKQHWKSGHRKGCIVPSLEDSASGSFESQIEFEHDVWMHLRRRAAEVHAERFEVEVVEYHQMSLGRFAREYGAIGRPVVIRGAGREWDRNVWSCDWMCENLADVVLRVRRGPSYDTTQTILASAPEFIQQVMSASRQEDMKEAPFYGANNICPEELIPHLQLPPFYPEYVFLRDAVRMWLGCPGTGAPAHIDIHDNFLLHVMGSKTFWLAAPHLSDSLAPRRVSPWLWTTDADPRSADSSLHGGVKWHQITLNEGDMLYLPSGWWHSTLNGGVGPSCSVNFWMKQSWSAIGEILPEAIVQSDWGPLVPGARCNHRFMPHAGRLSER